MTKATAITTHVPQKELHGGQLKPQSGAYNA